MLRTPLLRPAMCLVLFGLAALLGACSGDSGKVYDTAANPEKFPQAAVDLIDNIQSNRLMGGPAIVDAFGELYTDHSELLDKPSWTEIIMKLGGRFDKVGDSLVTAGIADYALAAEYFELASFALPSEPAIRNKMTLFQTWHEAAEAPHADLSPLTDGSADIREVLSALRPFALIDNTLYKFLRAYLTDPLKERLQAAGQLEPTVIENLAPVDRALAAFCGLTSNPPSEVIAKFVSPHVDVVACRVVRTGDSVYSAEAYFIPQMEEPLRLAFGLTLLTADSSLIPVELLAPVPRHEWTKGKLAAVGREFNFGQPLVGMALALVDATEQPPRLVDVEGRDDAAWPLEIEIHPAPDSL